MEARELRIGSLLKDNLTGEWLRVTDLSENIVAEVINRDKYPLPDGWQMAPIPLTPEILEKAGFIMKDEGYLLTLDTVVEINQICIEYDWSVSIGDVNANGFFASNIGICKYVHQLQNIIFSLTGEELIIKL